MSNPALILIDIQNGFDDLAYWGGQRNNTDAEKKAAEILEHWRKKKLPVFFIRHDSTTKGSRLEPGQYGNTIKDVVKPLAQEVVVSKNVNSAFIGTDLKQRLDAQRISTVVLVGLTTDHCVSTTARMAGNLDYHTYVVSDATATFDRQTADGEKIPAELVHKIALASLHNEFAEVLNTKQLLQKF
jgi:nicotinamidase-related amidase